MNQRVLLFIESVVLRVLLLLFSGLCVETKNNIICTWHENRTKPWVCTAYSYAACTAFINSAPKKTFETVRSYETAAFDTCYHTRCTVFILEVPQFGSLRHVHPKTDLKENETATGRNIPWGLGTQRESCKAKWPIIYLFSRRFWVKAPPSFRKKIAKKRYTYIVTCAIRTVYSYGASS